MFEGSHDFVINGGIFASHSTTGTTGLQWLSQNIAVDAFHDSAARFPPPRCHPDTREAILSRIMDWICDDRHRDRRPMMWLYGPAGAGKSAIAQTIAERCQDEKRLAASFFFSRGAARRRTEKNFVITIAYQLALSIPEAKPYIERAVDDDPSIISKAIEVQIRLLVVEPIHRVLQIHHSSHCHWPELIVVDGLDECEDANAQCRILFIIRSVLDRDSLPFRILIACRPEPDIRDFFNEGNCQRYCQRLALDNWYS